MNAIKTKARNIRSNKCHGGRKGLNWIRLDPKKRRQAGRQLGSASVPSRAELRTSRTQKADSYMGQHSKWLCWWLWGFRSCGGRRFAPGSLSSEALLSLDWMPMLMLVPMLMRMGMPCDGEAGDD